MREIGHIIYNANGECRPVYPSKESHSKVEDKILKKREPFSVDELAGEMEVGPDVVRGVIDALKEKGFTFGETDGVAFRSKTPVLGETFDARAYFPGTTFRFGVASDTHLSDKHERLDALNNFYDDCVREGISTIFHPGDLTTGYGVFRGQEFELKQLGQEEQIDYAIKEYPQRQGVTTIAISGNHDLKQYEKGGCDPLVGIAACRPDIKYVGQMAGKVLLSDEVLIELLHPAGGQAYALSYKAQREINARNPNDLPDILVYGHYHVAFYMLYRGVHFIQAPAFKDPGIFEKRLGLASVIGGWIVEAQVGQDGKITRFKPELLRYDTTKK